MKIEVVKGDTSNLYKFQRKNSNGEIITTLPQKMWITFKKSPKNEKSLFQKTLADKSIIYDINTNYYKFKLESEDTYNLEYGTYGFDISILNEYGEKKTLVNDGCLEVLKHYTERCDEV